jgi:hypothetical protein
MNYPATETGDLTALRNNFPVGADRFRPPLMRVGVDFTGFWVPRSRNASLIELGRATLSTVATDLQAGLVLAALALVDAYDFVKKRRLVPVFGGFWTPW